MRQRREEESAVALKSAKACIDHAWFPGNATLVMHGLCGRHDLHLIIAA